MDQHADVVSPRRLGESLIKAMPELQARARLESADAQATRQLLNSLKESVAIISAEPESPGVMATFRDPTSSLLQTFLAQQVSDSKVNPVRAGGLEAKFDSNDILGWFGSFFTWWKKISPHPWLQGDVKADPFPDIARVALLADWGTGLYGAPVCAESIAKDTAGFQLVMHLGDVYYSGDEQEMQDRFLKLWPRVDGAINRALNGNHEMYTGGKAYFGTTLPSFQQKASYFAFQNKHWLLICLDTAYAEHDLAGDQANWVTQLIAGAGERKVILFSHHQPYSILDIQGPKLIAKLRPHLEGRRIYAWYWGHEHRCVIYEPHSKWGLLGRCIGHSGFPEFRKTEWGAAPERPVWLKLDATTESPAAVVLDGKNPYVIGHEVEYGPHGFVTLQFENEKFKEFVHLPDGSIVELAMK